MNFYKLLSFVSTERKAQINWFYSDIDKKLSLYTDLLVGISICQALNISNSEIKFSKGVYGKPYVDNYPGIHYNISHTRNAIAVAVSEENIGVDIEKIRKAEFENSK